VTSGGDAIEATARPTLVEALLRPEVYPHPVHVPVRIVETHVSWVLLTGRHAYKIKKPVDLGFVDFSTLARRVHAAREEVRLNRRLAPAVYEGLVWISGTLERPVLGEPGADRPTDALEVCVRMREFPQEAQLDRRFSAGLVGRAEVLAMARSIARFHASVERAPADSAHGTAPAVMAPVRENFAQIAARLPDAFVNEALGRLRDWSEATGADLAPLFEQRKRDGFVTSWISMTPAASSRSTVSSSTRRCAGSTSSATTPS
jgi:aminoglycoside phosphotransferase family enzyme